MHNKKSPVLLLIGVGSVIAATGLLAACDDEAPPAVHVQRTEYASLDACLADWNDMSDCESIADDANAASGTSGTYATLPASGTGTGSSGGGGHGGGAHWYGPYYTREGRIYHANGTQTTGYVPESPHGTTTSLVVRDSELEANNSEAFSHTPESVSVSEDHAISRGGFMTAAHGEGGHGGGGGEGGGGGGHGSGGG